MIAADTSTWIAFLEGASGDDVRLLDKALEVLNRRTAARESRAVEGTHTV